MPQLPFQDAKRYWDGKNEIYGLKCEIAVSLNAPHYCLFVSEAVPAARHDYNLHKDVCDDYLEYLKMTPNEILRLNVPQGSFWKILADKGYIGSADATLPILRVTPKKRSHLDDADRERNRAINTKRVVVESFLGRLSRLWGIFADSWRWDHSHFDADFTIACLLTNHELENSLLSVDDAQFLLKLKEARKRQTRRERRRKAEASKQSRQRRNEQLRIEMALDHGDR